MKFSHLRHAERFQDVPLLYTQELYLTLVKFDGMAQ